MHAAIEHFMLCVSRRKYELLDRWREQKERRSRAIFIDGRALYGRDRWCSVAMIFLSPLFRKETSLPEEAGKKKEGNGYLLCRDVRWVNGFYGAGHHAPAIRSDRRTGQRPGPDSCGSWNQRSAFACKRGAKDVMQFNQRLSRCMLPQVREHCGVHRACKFSISLFIIALYTVFLGELGAHCT